MASLCLFYRFLSLVGLCLCVLHGTNASYISDNDELQMTKYSWDDDLEAEMRRTACELAQARNYTCEEHEVETKDGYILTLHRLPLQKMNCKTRDKVVLLNHGFLGSSTNFLINGPKESLGYLFSDACYDVWLMNARGNTYSLKHNTYTTDDEEYWKFSFDEMAEYDLPATIDHILEKTKQKSLYYVAHSQGATIGFEAFSENKALAKKIRLFAALGPVGYAGHMTTSGTFYAEMTDETIYALLGRKSFLGGDWKREAFLKATCTNSMTSNTCVKFGELLGGKFSAHLNKSRLLVYYMHTPAGSSVQNLVHWTQMMRTKETHKHFYIDHLKNLAKYGSWTPPQIRFSRMDLPLVAFTGNHDTAADEKDIKRLMKEFPNVVARIQIADYSHLDLIYATNTEETIFKPLSFLMKNY